MTVVRRLNHAVLFVADAERAAAFYGHALGLVEVSREMGGRAIFMRSPAGDNHHDLGLFAAPGAPHPPTGSITGLYHLAWEVDRVEDLAQIRDRLLADDAYTGESDHGTTLSVYGKDPDGNEFEVMWPLPRTDWGEFETRGVVRALDLDAALERYGVAER